MQEPAQILKGGWLSKIPGIQNSQVPEFHGE